MPSTAEVLQAASLALTRSLELDAVLETLLDYLAELVPYDSANVMLAEDAERLSVRAIRGYDAWVDSAEVRSVRLEARTNPIVEALFTGRKTLVVSDTRTHPGWQSLPGAKHVLSWMGVPLSAAGQVIGLYSLDKAEAAFFTEEHRRLAESLAPHAALAIHNARLLANERAARAEAERLQSVARALGASLQPSEVFAALLKELRALIPYDSAAVMQLEGGQMKIVGGHGFANLQEMIGVSFDLDAENPNREVARALAPLILDDAPARYPAFKAGAHATTPVRAWLGVPLLFGGRLIGMLSLDKQQPGFFTADHARLASSFAAQAAIAMENARLFAAVQCELAERQRAEARHRAFVEEAPYGLVAVDQGQRVVLVNREAERLFGYAKGEILGRHVERLVPEDSRDRLRTLLARGASAGVGGRAAAGAMARLSGRRGDGSEFPLDASLGSLEIDGERLVVAAVLDVTDRARAEEALRERTQQLQLALAATRMGVWHVDLKSDTYTTIQGGGPISGLPQELYPSTSDEFYALVHPDDRERVADRLRRSLEHGEPYQAEFRIVLPQGIRWVAAQGRTSRDAAGQPSSIIGVDLDVTDRKQAEDELRESEARYRELFHAHPLPMWVYDLESQRFRAVNNAATLAYGWSREEFLAMTLREIRPAEDWARLDASVAASRERPGYEHSEHWRHRTREGRLREVEIASHDISFEGRPARIVAVHDVTEKRELEAQFRQAQKLEAVGRLAGGIAHDFNNMLGVILGFAQLALKRLDRHDPVRHNIQRIVEAAERSAGLTRQLLAFARRQTISPRVLDLNAEIASLTNMLGRLVGEDIRLEVLPGQGLWRVKLDPVQLGQVLANLATNARDAIHDVGSITVETSNVTLDDAYCRVHPGFSPGQYVRLVVSDSGSGMDAATRERIFEPFFTTKAEGQGTGLGLATVFGIVKQNGGFINAYSEPGHGTTFRIYLPRCPDEPAAEGVAEPPAARGGRETLLLVEDEPQLLELTKEGLEQFGYTVLCAASPGEALLLCEKHDGAIDLLVTDVVMPGMNGKELRDRLESLRPGLPVLFMSGYTANAIAHRGVLDAGVRFIEKPFSLDALGAKVREAIEGR